MSKMKNKDRLYGGITRDGSFMYSILCGSDLVADARTRHSLEEPAVILLGQLMIGSLLAASKFKSEERISFSTNTDGPINKLHAEANGVGEVRGYAGNPSAVAGGKTLDEALQNTLGSGQLNCYKALANHSQPVNSTIELQYRNVVKDLAWYYTMSEQIPTAFRIVVRPGDQIEAWGLMIQALPGAEADATQRLQQAVSDFEPGEFSNTPGFCISVLNGIFKDMPRKELRHYPVHFYCRCSRDRMADALMTLGKDELNDMAKQGTQELVCHYCNEKYYFTPDELLTLMKKNG